MTQTCIFPGYLSDLLVCCIALSCQKAVLYLHLHPAFADPHHHVSSILWYNICPAILQAGAAQNLFSAAPSLEYLSRGQVDWKFAFGFCQMFHGQNALKRMNALHDMPEQCANCFILHCTGGTKAWWMACLPHTTSCVWVCIFYPQAGSLQQTKIKKQLKLASRDFPTTD